MERCNEQDRSLVEGIMKREEAAFEMLINTYGGRLLKVCYLILKETSLAEDAVQEVFIQIYKSIYNFNYKASLYTWIYKIAINKCRDMLRRKGQLDFSLEPERMLSDSNLEQDTIDQLRRDNIRQLVDKLPQIYKEIVVLFYFEVLSVKEIAIILEEKENTVKSRLLRARSILKELFIREGIVDAG